MLTELVIENFKAFGERQVIPLAPITLIFGSNSAGKSSLIQALLLMKQSDLATGKLVIRGELTDRASYRALIHQHDTDRRLALGLAGTPMPFLVTDNETGELVRFSDGRYPIGFEILFGLQENGAGLSKTVEQQSLRLNIGGKFISLEPLPFEGSADVLDFPRREYKLSEIGTRDLFGWVLREKQKNNPGLDSSDFELHPRAVAILEGFKRGWQSFSFARFEDEDAGLIKSNESGRQALLMQAEEQDEEILSRTDEMIRELQEILDDLGAADPSDSANEFLLLATARARITRDDGYTADDILRLDRHALARVLKAKIRIYRAFRVEREMEEPFKPWPRSDASKFVSDYLQFSFRELASSLEGLQYLGPLREVPERFTVLTGAHQGGVGARGENLVAKLLEHDQLWISDTNKWLKQLEIHYEIQLRSLGGEVSHAVGDVIALLLKDRRTGVVVSAADVGFGISQILPVVVASLTLNGTLCIEQPEIHLHPGLQARLGDLFAHAFLDGPDLGLERQFILETHSEHLVLRMQRLIRRGRLKPEDVCVLHVGFEDGGRSVVKRLDIDALGEFTTDWPGGFFDERLDEVFGN